MIEVIRSRISVAQNALPNPSCTSTLIGHTRSVCFRLTPYSTVPSRESTTVGGLYHIVPAYGLLCLFATQDLAANASHLIGCQLSFSLLLHHFVPSIMTSLAPFQTVFNLESLALMIEATLVIICSTYRVQLQYPLVPVANRLQDVSPPIPPLTKFAYLTLLWVLVI